MAIQSTIEYEGPGEGVGNGNGKALGHIKQAMADGVYTMDITGIDATNHGSVDAVTPPTTLADGSMMNTEVRAGHIASVAGPAGGEGGSLMLETDSSNGRLRVNDAFSSAQQFKLGDLHDLSFDYNIESSDRADVIPVIRVAIDADGNLATTSDRGELVFEYAYQNLGSTQTGSWQHADLAGDDWNAWQRSNGANHDVYPDIQHLSNWSDADGYTPAGGIHFDANSVVLGWSIALGSGNGTDVMYLDNLHVGGVTYDFAI